MLFESTADTIVAGIVLSLIYLKAVQLLQPYADEQLNIIKETSLWQIFFVFLIALLIMMDNVDRDFLTVCLLITFFVNILIVGGQLVLHGCIRLNCVGSTDTDSSFDVGRATEVEMSTSRFDGISLEVNKGSENCNASLTTSPFHIIVDNNS